MKLKLLIPLLLVVVFAANGQTSDANFITTHTARIPLNTADISDVTNQDQVMRSTQYFDGIGRPIQSIIRKGAPNDTDLVTPITYDAYGRQSIQYLPYAKGTSGNYRSSWSAEIDDFYDGTYSNDVVNEATYYYN